MGSRGSGRIEVFQCIQVAVNPGSTPEPMTIWIGWGALQNVPIRRTVADFTSRYRAVMLCAIEEDEPRTLNDASAICAANFQAKRTSNRSNRRQFAGQRRQPAMNFDAVHAFFCAHHSFSRFE